MKANFSIFENPKKSIEALEKIDKCIKISLGPIGKTGIFFSNKNELKFLTSGSLLIKSMELYTPEGRILLSLIEQASIKTHKLSGDGSTTTLLFICQILKTSCRLFESGYNNILLSNGLKKISYFFSEKILELSRPISTEHQLKDILKTSLGQKTNREIMRLLQESVSQVGRDGLLIIEENVNSVNELELIQGIELDRGFASSYFINDIKNFKVIYENPYLLLSSNPIESINQLVDIIEYIKRRNRPLIIVVEKINKEVLSTLILNTIQKRLKVVVIKYSSVKFLQTGFLEDLAILSYANYFKSSQKDEMAPPLTPDDLGQIDKVIITKEKSTFFLSKFSKAIIQRRINELARDLVTSETDVEKNVLRNRIARLSGNITKLKIGVSNQYQIDEERQRIEKALFTLKSSLEEGILPGGGAVYLYLIDEIKQWSTTNLVGEESFSMQMVIEALERPFNELYHNSNIVKARGFIREEINQLGYPYGYDIVAQKVCNTFIDGLVDSAKTVRLALWNSLTLSSIILTSE